MRNNLHTYLFPQIVEIRYQAEASHDMRIIRKESSQEDIFTKLMNLLGEIDQSIKTFKNVREETKKKYPKLFSLQ